MEIPINKADLETTEFRTFETNDEGEMVSHTTNLRSVFDPKSLAEQAVGLNLKLMKWRMAPDIDLDVIKT